MRLVIIELEHFLQQGKLRSPYPMTVKRLQRERPGVLPNYARRVPGEGDMARRELLAWLGQLADGKAVDKVVGELLGGE